MLIDYIDGETRKIYLSEDSMNASWHPVELYREIRTLRASEESLRPYDNFMRGGGNINKGGGKATERYFTLLNGTRIVPFNSSHVIDVTGTLITDDGLEGVFCFDRSSLDDGVAVDIQYAPKQVEVINLNFDDLVYSSFQMAAWVDEVNGYTDKGTDNLPNGNTERPVNNIQLAVEIAKERGFRTIQVIGNVTLSEGDDVRDFHLIGTSHVNSNIEVLDAAQCERTKFSSFIINGKLDGNSEITDCVINDLTYFNGHIHNCMLNGKITLSGDANAIIDDCAMVNILNVPTIDCNNSEQNLIMTNWSGSLNVINSGVNNNIGVGCDAGVVNIDSSCTDGIIALSGTGDANDYSANDCYVINKLVDGSDMQNLKFLIEQLRPHHTGGGNMIFWDPHSGSDLHHGDAPDRGFKTWQKCHDQVINANHDIIVIVPSNPTGLTVITEQINVTKDYLFIRGPGRDVVVKQDTETATLKTTARGTEFSGFRVHNTVEGGHGLHSTGAFTLAENLWFENCESGALFESMHPLIHSCKIFNSSIYGIKIMGDSAGGEIHGCNIGKATGSGIIIDTNEGYGGVEMRDTIVVEVEGYGITLSETTTKFVSQSGNIVIHNSDGNFDDQGINNVLNTEGSIGDVTIDAKDVWEYNQRTLTEGSELDEAQLHNALDSYENKNEYKATPQEMWEHGTRELTEDVSVDLGPTNRLIVDSKKEVIAKIEDSEQDIRQDLVDIQFGNWKIVSNQMIVYNKQDAEIARFNLFDAAGNPTMRAVYERRLV